MLFPGAIYIIAIFLGFVGICFSIAVGFLGGAVIKKIAYEIIEKTKTRKSLKMGKNIPWPWWCHSDRWFFLGWIATTVVVIYCILGPYWYLITWLGGK